MVFCIRRLTAAAVCAAVVALGGCDTSSTTEPMGSRIYLEERDEQPTKDFLALTEHVWREKRGKDAPIEFDELKGMPDGFIVTLPIGRKPLQLAGFARSWEDRLLLQVAWVEMKTQKPVLLFCMVKIEQDPKEGLIARMYRPKKEAFLMERDKGDGTKVKLDVEVGKNLVAVKSDEATIAGYLALCKPSDLFEESGVMTGYTREEFRKIKQREDEEAKVGGMR